MSVTTELRKTMDEARTVLTDPTPLHAIAGAGDLLVAHVRTIASAQRTALQSVRIDRDELPARMTKAVEDAQHAVRDAIAGLPELTQDAVVSTATRATATYEELASRGATLVKRIRGQQATEDLGRRVESTVRNAKATGTTARSGASTTATRVRSTTTSARRAAEAATVATKKAAEKTGTTATRKSAARKTATKASPAAAKASTPTRKAAAKTSTTTRKPSTSRKTG